MNSSIRNPYEDLQGTWLRGNFHGHNKWTSRCASVPLREAVRRYRAMGAAFTSFTNHDRVLGLERARARTPDIVLLQGFEHSAAENLVFVGETVAPLHPLPLGQALEAADGLLTFACHPRPRRNEEHWTMARLRALPRLPDGVEVYNGHYGVPRMVAKGCVPLYTDFWDELLTAGLLLWGLANDDSHDPPDFGNAWNMVCARSRAAADIIEAARAGRFYGTTGLLASEIHGHGPLLRVSFGEEVTGRFVGPGGRALSERVARGFEHRLGDEAYARFEAQSKSGRVFLQPVCHAAT